MKPHDTFTNGIKNLMKWMEHREAHHKHKRINEVVKLDANPLPSNSIIGQYK